MSMPRSLADRSSLSRGSVITGRSDAISVGSAVTRHWVNSVSDIYGPDEIEELLEDLNRLEMASFDGIMMFDNDPVPPDHHDLSMRPTSSEMNIMRDGEAVISGCITQLPDDDLEDFDIDGSHVRQPRRQQFDGGGQQLQQQHRQRQQGVRPQDAVLSSPPVTTANLTLSSSRAGVGGVDPSATADRLSRRPSHRHHRRGSSSWSVRSWDSHAHYQDFPDEVDNDEDEDETDMAAVTGAGLFPSKAGSSIVCYCDMSTFKTPRTLLRVLLVVTSIACLSTVVTAGTAKMGLFELPHFPRLRIMMFITIFTFIFTLFILFLNISHLYALLPVDYGKMQTIVYLFMTIAYIVASSLVFHAHLDESLVPSLLPRTKTQTLAIALLGFTCALEAFICSFNCGRPPLNTKTHYDKMAESSTHFTLHETVTTNQSRAITDDSLQQKQAGGGTGMSSRNSKNRSDQYLINENFDNPGGSGFSKRGGSSNHHHNSASAPLAPPLSHSSVDKSALHNNSKSYSRPDDNDSRTKAWSKSKQQTTTMPQQPPEAEGQSFSKGNTSSKIMTSSGGVVPAISSTATPQSANGHPASTKVASNGHMSKSSANKTAASSTDHHRTTGVITKATVECGSDPLASLANSEQQLLRNTGAIPKQRNNNNNSSNKNNTSKQPASSSSQHQQPPSSVTKPSTNHLDEIVSLPLDDAGDHHSRPVPAAENSKRT